MNAKWIYGVLLLILTISAILPLSLTIGGREECVECFEQCDTDYALCLDECNDLPPGEIFECRQDCRQEYIQCNNYCRWEVC